MRIAAWSVNDVRRVAQTPATDRTKKAMPAHNNASRTVALYWDFENLHAGLLEAKYGKAPTPGRTTASRRRNR